MFITASRSVMLSERQTIRLHASQNRKLDMFEVAALVYLLSQRSSSATNVPDPTSFTLVLEVLTTADELSLCSRPGRTSQPMQVQRSCRVFAFERYQVVNSTSISAPRLA
jgi:hypothetical protein